MGAIGLLLTVGTLGFTYYKSGQEELHGFGRQLSGSAGSCEDIKKDMPSWENDFGGGLLHMFIMFYVFVALAIVCDDYFCESLEMISENLGLSEDVAGATFMAAGSSAPELFVSFADNVLADPPKSLGVGTIIGSAIFNILIIIALTAALAGQELQLDYRPLARDSAWYTISIMLMIIAIYDKKVNAVESVILVLGYVGYVVYMAYNTEIQARLCPAGSSGDGKAAAFDGAVVVDASDVNFKIDSDESESAENGKAGAGKQGGGENGKEKGKVQAMELEEKKEGASESEDDEDGPYFGSLMLSHVADASIFEKICWAFNYPINLALRVTVPDCSRDRFSSPLGFTTTFFMSIGWIGVLSHFLVESATKFGCIVSMPFPLMGLTIVAAGTSVPDAISSVVVAKSGQGDMAVSNAIGSNVFDILLGLGLPYLLCNIIRGKNPVVETDDLVPSICILYGVLAAVIGILWYSKWRLNPKVGMALFGLYFCYVVYAYVDGLE